MTNALFALTLGFGGGEARLAPPDSIEVCRTVHVSVASLAAPRARTLRFEGAPLAIGFRTRGAGGPACPEQSGIREQGSLELRGFGGVRHGVLLVAQGSPFAIPPPEAASERADPQAGLRARQAIGSRTDVQVEAVLGARTHVETLLVQSSVGPFRMWGGRSAVGYGPGKGGGLILSGTVPLDAVGVGLVEPAGAPRPLHWLGDGDFELFLARTRRNGGIEAPWLLAGRAVVSPSRSVAIGVNRGLMFGGDGVDRLSARQFIEMLFGAHPRDSEGATQTSNQVASVDAAWSPRVRGVPLLAYVEWGFEDNSGAWFRSPGIISGIEVVHPERGVRVGVERTYLSKLNDRHGVWYRHTRYQAGWSDAGRPLGHPLAGPGTEWLLHGVVHGDEERWDLAVGLRTRHRLPENSFSPNLEGRSFGGFVNGWVRTGPVDLYLQVDGERTRSGTDVLTAEAGVRWSRTWQP